jgi:hypothetical protein
MPYIILTSIFYVYIYILFYTLSPPFDKVEPVMAFAEKLSWHRERGPCKPNDV